MTVSTHPLSPPADTFSGSPVVPDYLEQTYWWAYVHPRAVRFFEREWIVNLILFGNYRRLRNRALTALGTPVRGSTLQVACVYGNLTPQLVRRLDDLARLQVVDVLPIQLQNLAAKLPPDPRVSLKQADSSALDDADASHDQVLLFFLLHEQPEPTRRRTLREALRVLRPGGRMVIVDYHKPRAWHPLKPLMQRIFHRLEPFAHDLWEHPVSDYLPTDWPVSVVEHTTCFGGLYQLLVLERGRAS
jgi:ubiquinone/menaquinone biosynthesis C-methylase UbiE